MHNYQSGISRGQIEAIRTELEQTKHMTELGKYDLYDIFCAVLYVLHGRVKWRIFHLIIQNGVMAFSVILS